MTLDEAKQHMGASWVLHPAYKESDHPHHSAYARVDLRATWLRVKRRMRDEQSLSGAVEQVKRKLRIIHGRTEAA